MIHGETKKVQSIGTKQTCPVSKVWPNIVYNMIKEVGDPKIQTHVRCIYQLPIYCALLCMYHAVQSPYTGAITILHTKIYP